MKTKLQRLTHYLIATLLGLLGFSACSDEEENDMVVEYGVPSADYIIKGSVTDEADNPIEGIVIAPHEYAKHKFPPFKTDASGYFNSDTLYHINYGLPPIIFSDPDGEANGGSFENDTLSYQQFKVTQLEGGKGWYDGVFELKADIKLKKKVKE